MATRRTLTILSSSFRCLSSVAFQPVELQGVYNFGVPSRMVQAGEIGEVSGIPEAHLHRQVIIYSPAQTASQQGGGRTGKWKIGFQSTQKWENPLMGWTSSGDPYHAVGDAALVFDTKEAAMEFASKYGWQFKVHELQQMVVRSKAYAENFKGKGPDNK